MTDDIVKQLRDSAIVHNCRCPYCNRNKAAAQAAAHEIERLRNELAKVSEELEEMLDNHRGSSC
jgi:glutaredoxin